MRAIIKLAALVIVVILLAPVVAGETRLAQVVSAALDDARNFCERQPETCRQTAEIVAAARDTIADTISALREDAAPGPLTAQDRALEPPYPDRTAGAAKDEGAKGGGGAVGFDAFAGNNPAGGE